MDSVNDQPRTDDLFKQFEFFGQKLESLVHQDKVIHDHDRVPSVIQNSCSNVFHDGCPLSGDAEEPKIELSNAEQVDQNESLKHELGSLMRYSSEDLNSKELDEDIITKSFIGRLHPYTFQFYNGLLPYDSENGCVPENHEVPIPQQSSVDEDIMISTILTDQPLILPLSNVISTQRKSVIPQNSIKPIGSGRDRISSSVEAYETNPLDPCSYIPISGSNEGNTFGFDSAIICSKMDMVELSPADFKTAATTFHSSNQPPRKGFSYYKKLIKDKLTSRSRLSEEYKLLNLAHSEESSRNLTPVTRDLTETDWELV